MKALILYAYFASGVAYVGDDARPSTDLGARRFLSVLEAHTFASRHLRGMAWIISEA